MTEKCRALEKRCKSLEAEEQRNIRMKAAAKKREESGWRR